MKISNSQRIRLIKTGLLSVYRDRSMLITDFFLATSIPFVIQAIIWTYVITPASRQHLTLDQTYLYYACALSLNRLHNCYDLITKIAEHINLGQLECHLIKPIKYKTYNTYLFLGESLLYALPPIIIAIYIGYTTENYYTSAVFIALIIPNQYLCFHVGFFLASLVFFLKKPDFILTFHVVAFGVIGGTLLPPSYWPEHLAHVMTYNPFHALVGGPAELLLRPSAERAHELITLSFIWLFFFTALSTSTFNKLQRKYTGAGG